MSINQLHLHAVCCTMKKQPRLHPGLNKTAQGTESQMCKNHFVTGDIESNHATTQHKENLSYRARLGKKECESRCSTWTCPHAVQYCDNAGICIQVGLSD